jgi:S1-C subfamily serine protease
MASITTSGPNPQKDNTKSARFTVVCNIVAIVLGDLVNMSPWVANLLGLALGCVIGGEALYIAIDARDDLVGSPAAVAAPVVARRGPRLSERVSTQLVVQPVQPPRVEPSQIVQPDAAALPKVLDPNPAQQPHAPGSGIAGTGFFVAADGSLLTAAHVVVGCTRIRIASRWVQPTAAYTVAADAAQDVALLRANQATPPAILPIGRPAGPTGRLFVLGYPESGGPLAATEAWAVLENPQFQPGPADLTDPRRVIWAAAPAVGHGFSGGPMLDPRNGQVVGIVRGMVDSTRLHSVRAAIPATGMVIGPGSSPLNAILRQEKADDDVLPAFGDAALDNARRATVHVLCLY